MHTHVHTFGHQAGLIMHDLSKYQQNASKEHTDLWFNVNAGGKTHTLIHTTEPSPHVGHTFTLYDYTLRELLSCG